MHYSRKILYILVNIERHFNIQSIQSEKNLVFQLFTQIFSIFISCSRRNFLRGHTNILDWPKTFAQDRMYGHRANLNVHF